MLCAPRTPLVQSFLVSALVALLSNSSLFLNPLFLQILQLETFYQPNKGIICSGTSVPRHEHVSENKLHRFRALKVMP